MRSNVTHTDVTLLPLIADKIKIDAMSIMHAPNYKKPFAQFVKKQNRPFQAVIEDHVSVICTDPEIGEQKVGDLAGIRVYKFKYQRQPYLIAYRPATKPAESLQILLIDFYKVGTHENFYAELKKYLAAEKKQP